MKPDLGPRATRLLLDLDKGETCPADFVALKHVPGVLVGWLDPNVNPDEFLEFEGAFGVCPNCGGVVADLISIEDVLEEEGLDAADIVAFEWQGQRLDATVWGGPLEGLAWAEYAQSMDEMHAMHDTPVPADAEVRALPQRLEAWELQVTPGPPVGEGGSLELSYVALVAAPDGMIRGSAVQLEAFNAQSLGDLLRRACATPMMGMTASRPSTVRINDPLLADALEASMSALGVRVEVGDTPLANEAVKALLEHMDPNPIPPFLAPHDEGEVRTFLEASRAFFKAKPWKVFDGDKLVAFRFAGETAWRYANVMGQAGEEYGLSVFQNWLEVCKFYNNDESPMEMMMQLLGGNLEMDSDSPFGGLLDDEFELDPAMLGKMMPKRMRAVGGMEGLTASGLDALSSEDADYLKRLGVKPVLDDLWPGVLRYTLDGLAEPQVALRAYTALLEAVAGRAEKGKKRVTSMTGTVETSQGAFEVRYPAKGDESSSTKTYRLEMPMLTRSEVVDEHPVKLGKDRSHVEVIAPGDTKFHKVVREFRRALEGDTKHSPELHGVQQGEFNLWQDRAPTLEPSPTVADLAALEGLVLKFGLNQAALRVVAVEHPVTEMVSRIVKP